jgi:hypothetical protein
MDYINAFTDYPFVELGDKAYDIARIRRCKVIAYDRDKYVAVMIGRKILHVKAGYVYKTYGRCGNVQNYSNSYLRKLPRLK